MRGAGCFTPWEGPDFDAVREGPLGAAREGPLEAVREGPLALGVLFEDGPPDGRRFMAEPPGPFDGPSEGFLAWELPFFLGSFSSLSFANAAEPANKTSERQSARLMSDCIFMGAKVWG